VLQCPKWVTGGKAHSEHNTSGLPPIATDARTLRLFSRVHMSRHPPSHSITTSARASRVGGTSRPRALAVCRLMTNSNLVDCKTGRSAGLAPLKILTGVGADPTIHIRTIGRVGHQPAGFDSLARGIGRGNPIARRGRRKLNAPAREEHVASDMQSVGALAHEGGEGASGDHLDCLYRRTWY
jgi:hypothetical protein